MTPAEIKTRFRLRDEIASRGIEINRTGFCRCPIHANDDTPSMKIYDSQNAWYCYACQKGGDIIDFVQLVDHLSFRDACRQISGEDLTRESRARIDRAKLKREAERIREQKQRRKERELESKICDYWNEMKEYEPTSMMWGWLYGKWQKALYRYSELTGGLAQELWP